MTTASPESDSQYSSRAVSGWKIVMVMLAFGIAATGTLWGYWYYHSAPFVPLQTAIAAEFPASAPRVDGGQRKMHKGTEKLLWIIMRVDFNPKGDSSAASRTVERVIELTRENVDVTDFEQINVRLFFGELEKEIHSRDFEVPLVAD